MFIEGCFQVRTHKSVVLGSEVGKNGSFMVNLSGGGGGIIIKEMYAPRKMNPACSCKQWAAIIAYLTQWATGFAVHCVCIPVIARQNVQCDRCQTYSGSFKQHSKVN